MRYTIFRIALVMGTIMFGIVEWFVVHSSGPSAPEDQMGAMVYVFILLAVIAVAGNVILRRRQRRVDIAARFTLGVIGWALCDASALFGGVYLLITGNPLLYLTGLGLLVGSLFYLSP